jgi:hypothetical protein
MRFVIHTLVDITETGSRRGEDPKQYRQQQNFLTVMQTIGMRVNPEYISPPTIISEVPSKLGLGTSYKNKQSVWKYAFDMEFEGALNVETLVNDFDLIPIITQLDETVEFNNAQFITKNVSLNNISFEIVDK